MADDTTITELVALEAERVDGVGSPANGTNWLLIKATSDDATSDDTKQCPTCNGSGKILEGHRKCPDCQGSGKVPPDFAATQKAQTGEPSDEQDTSEAAKADKPKYKGVTADAKSQFQAQLKKDPTQHLSAANHRIAEWKATGNLPHGTTDADLNWMQNQIAAELHRRDPDSEAQGATKAGDGALEKCKALTDLLADASTETGGENAKKSDVQDALHGTDTPVEPEQTVAPGNTSGVSGPVTTGVAPVAQIPGAASSSVGMRAILDGGQSAYLIPAESNLDGTLVKAGAQANAAAKLMALIGEIDQPNAIKDVAPPEGAAATDISSMPWETYDSATLAQVAAVLSMCGAAIDAIQKREALEAITGDPSDWFDSWDLACAQDALDCALGVAARLSYVEQASAQAASKTTFIFEPAMSARDQLTALIENSEQAAKARDTAGSTTSEEDIMAVEVTKEELAEAIVAGSETAVAEQLSAFKQEMLDAIKNANNDGENTDLSAEGTIDDNLDPVAGVAVEPQFVNKGLANQLEEIVQKAVKAETDDLRGLVAKMGKRASQGGPILDGQMRAGLLAQANVGRDLAKSEDDQEITRLMKARDEATDPVQKARLSEDLTFAKLRAAAYAQFGNTNPISEGATIS